MEELTGVAVDGSRLFVKHDLNRLLAQVLQREGLERALEVLDQLTRRGFEVCKQSGGLLQSLLGFEQGVATEQPKEADWDEWQMYGDEISGGFLPAGRFRRQRLGAFGPVVAVGGARAINSR